jgi:xanthine dehydrogenase accessory factor
VSVYHLLDGASDNDAVFRAYRSWAGAPMAIATVISTWGSAPRPRGSHMLLHADGRMEGSVSGGCVENDIISAAAGVIASGQAVTRRYGVTDGSAWEMGLPCGGNIEVLIQPVAETGFPPVLFDAIDGARAAGQPVEIQTDLTTGCSTIRETNNENVFVNRYLPPRRLIVVGAVQIAQALTGIAHTLGLKPVVIDPRTRFLTKERFPDAILDGRWPDEAIASLRPNLATAVITLSHDTKIDDPALIAALAAPTGYVAALGSRRSHAARLERLRNAGVDPSALARIESPAGIDIHAIGAAEIALSIAAGMVRSLAQPKL